MVPSPLTSFDAVSGTNTSRHRTDNRTPRADNTMPLLRHAKTHENPKNGVGDASMTLNREFRLASLREPRAPPGGWNVYIIYGAAPYTQEAKASRLEKRQLRLLG